MIQLRLGFWLKGWNQLCAFNPGDVVSEVNLVRNWKPLGKVRSKISSCPPLPSIWKWNVDGSSRGKPSSAGIGGVLRDCRSIVYAQLAASVGVRESNVAEFLTIIFTLEICLEYDWLRRDNIIIESDSKNALSWINKAGSCPWNLRFCYIKLRNILLLLKNVLFVHVNRESNNSADLLVKRRVTTKGRIIEWFTQNIL
jgi:ribonuclease HI